MNMLLTNAFCFGRMFSYLQKLKAFEQKAVVAEFLFREPSVGARRLGAVYEITLCELHAEYSVGDDGCDRYIAEQ